ncbi:hypothetical protein KRR26_12355 [Corallococcus sp. M34]|uniref:hypothetical protein n=1 Tax=Citreicoccus inhibens TaxID=2849499 RepID=UPI001C211E27|nr:hypothetical protein [Citreicoccus inhibens]MBU8896405.1 hypothetical protein [Citreicoccus inhibens]
MSTRGATPSQPATPPRRRRRAVRALGFGVVALLVFEGVLNLVLNLGVIPHIVHRATSRTYLGWSRAWWLWPAPVHVQDFFLEQHDNDAQWRVDVERSEARLSLTSFLHRRVDLGFLHAWGVRVRVRPIPPLERAVPGPPSAHPWSVSLRGLEIRDGREVDWGHGRYIGPWEADGAVTLVGGERVSVSASRIELSQGAVELGQRRAANVDSMLADLTLDVPKKGPGAGDALGGLSGRARLKAELLPLDWLGPLLAHREALVLDEGAGHVEADVRWTRGRLAPDSRVEAQGEPLTLRLGPLRVRTPWHARGTVTAQGEGTREWLRFDFAPVLVGGYVGQLMELPEVALTFQAEPRPGERHPTYQRDLTVAPSRPMDLRTLNHWTGHTFRVDSGTAVLKARAQFESAQDTGDLHLSLGSDLINAQSGSVRMLGRARASIASHRLALREHEVGLDGTTLELTQVSADFPHKQVRGWEGTFSFPHALLALSPPSLDARFSGQFANADPFVALLTRKLGLPRFLAPLLDARDLRVSGRVWMGDAGMRVRELHATGSGLKLEASLDVRRDDLRARVLATVKGITGCVEVTPEGTHLHLGDARRHCEPLDAPP